MENHLDINSQFIPYNLALKIKELGFNEECLASYYNAGKKLDIYEYMNHGEYTILAPLWQQAFDWFLDKYKLHVIFNEDDWNEGKWTYKIVSLDKSIELDILHDSKYWIIKRCLESIQQTRLECLEKLIEIVETKKDSV